MAPKGKKAAKPKAKAQDTAEPPGAQGPAEPLAAAASAPAGTSRPDFGHMSTKQALCPSTAGLEDSGKACPQVHAGPEAEGEDSDASEDLPQLLDDDQLALLEQGEQVTDKWAQSKSGIPH